MQRGKNNQGGSRTRWMIIGLLTVSGLYLIIDHGQHLLPYLPFAFLLGCLAMHVFMHGGHGHGGGGSRHRHGSESDANN